MQLLYVDTLLLKYGHETTEEYHGWRRAFRPMGIPAAFLNSAPVTRLFGSSCLFRTDIPNALCKHRDCILERVVLSLMRPAENKDKETGGDAIGAA